MLQDFEATRPRRRAPDKAAEFTLRLRSCLGRFATGVAVVTFDGPNGRQGLTVNSFTSVSMRPPLVLVSIVKTARSHDALPGLAFCVNILGAEQEPIARRFAGRDQSAVVRWMESPRAPRIRGAAAHIECVPWRTYDGGDHRLFVGEVVDFASREGDLLGYVGSRFTTIAEPHLGVEYLI